MTEKTQALIIGAGLTGLSCAYHLGKGTDYRLLERASQVGGLAKTIKRPSGFLCDGTGHWLHLRTPEIRSLVDTVLEGNLAPRTRRARVFSKGIFTLYPFQANTYGLPNSVIAECVTGLIQARYETKHPEPQNYRDWIMQEFGQGICKHFMVPYNEKIYGVPLETLAADFAAKYIPRPKIESVVEGALGLSKEALGYNAQFVYPQRGGIGALAEGLHGGCLRKAEFGKVPTAIDLESRTVTLEDGERIGFEALVSTIPLPELVRLCQVGTARGVPEPVLEATRRLRANSVLYFDIAIRGAPAAHQDYHWIYVPERDFPFYRVGSYSAVEPSLAPPNHRSYYVEIGSAVDVDPKSLEQPVMEGLRRLGILEDERDLVFMIPNILSPAYVLFDEHYTQSRQTVLDWAEHERVISMGRYGRWQYNAMEDAMLEGKMAADIVAKGSPA